MQTFAEYFGLKDRKRAGFELDPERDYSVFVDLDGIEDEIVERITEQGPPKLVVQGDFGTGKTHVLRFISSRLGGARKWTTIYKMLGGFQRKSNFRDLYTTMMAQIEPEILPRIVALSTSGKLEKVIGDALLQDVRRALQLLTDPKDAIRANARAWLLGTGPTPTQARNLGLSGKLFEAADPVALMEIWKLCGRIVRATSNTTLVLVIDEGESFSRIVDPEAQAHIGSGLRGLFDVSNHDVGCLMGLNTPDVRQGIHPLLRSDVASRVNHRKILLKPLDGQDRVIRFYSDLWRLISQNPALLSARAAQFFGSRILEMHAAIAQEPRTNSTTQRKVVQVLDYIGHRAYAAQSPLPLPESALKGWFNLS